MEKYYFSPFKICYLFGIINIPIILILYFIISYIPCEKSHFCYIKYYNKYYFDNIYNYFINLKTSKIIYDISSTFLSSLYDLILNITIQNYPFCYTFFPDRIYDLTLSLFEIFEEENKLIKFFLIITYILELLVILILIEIIEIKFCGLNEYFRINMYRRSVSELSDDSFINVDKFEIENNYIVNYENDEKENNNHEGYKEIELENGINMKNSFI